MNLKEAYLAGHKACGLKVGDKVKILRAPTSFEQGWGAGFYNSYMHLSGMFIIKNDADSLGFQLNDDYYYPWFVLEKVGEEEKEQKIKTSDLDFGCQQQNVESLVQRIINYIDKEK